MTRRLIALAFSLLLVACANPAADKPKAVTSEAAPAPSNAVGGQRFAITPANSQISFVGSKVTGSHNGSFERFEGAIDFAGQPEKRMATAAGKAGTKRFKSRAPMNSERPAINVGTWTWLDLAISSSVGGTIRRS